MRPRCRSYRLRGLLIGTALVLAASNATAVGVSLSYLFPRGGVFSTPVSPLSIRDIGVTFGGLVGISSSLSLYSLHGLQLVDSTGVEVIAQPVIGPVYSSIFSVSLKASLPVEPVRITVHAGGFATYLFNFHTIDGGFDAVIEANENVDSVTTNFTTDGRLGYGLVFGGSLMIKITDEIGLLFAGNYYMGQAPLTITGTYAADGATSLAVPSYLQNVGVDLTGLELSIGAELIQ